MTRRLLLAYLSITAFALIVVAVPLGLTFSSRERDRLYFDLERDAQAVGSRVEGRLEAGERPNLTKVFADYQVPGGRIVVVDDYGLSVADSSPKVCKYSARCSRGRSRGSRVMRRSRSTA